MINEEGQIMDKKVFKSIVLLITYSIILTAIIMKIELVLVILSNFMLILSPLFIGVAIAFILSKPYNFFFNLYSKLFKKGNVKKLSKPLAMVTVYVIFIGVINAIVAFIIPQFSDSVRMLYNNIGDYSSNIETYVIRVAEYLKLENINFSTINDTIQKLPESVSNFASGLLPRIFDFTTSFVRALVNIIIGLILSIYLLADKNRLKRQASQLLMAYLEKRRATKIIHIAEITGNTFSKFVAGQLTESVILGTLCFIGMIIFKFDYPILISVMIGVTSLIPVVGAIIGLIPSLFILLMIDPMQAVWFFVFLIILQQLEGNLIYPKVVGESIGLPALWVLLAIIIGGGLFGILGMLLGVPTVSVIYQLLKKDVYSKLNEN